jgi:hypothetical protein
MNASQLNVARRRGGRYDRFRLQALRPYRELFERGVKQALEREGWEIVRSRCHRAAEL